MKFFLEIFTLALFAVSAHSKLYSKCEDKDTSNIISLSVLKCVKAPCDVFIGRNVTAKVTFVAAHDSKKLIPKVQAKVNIFGFPMTEDKPFSQKNACSTLMKGNCPLKKGDIATYYFSMPVESLIGGGLSANVEVSLVNERGKSIGCLALPVKIYYP